MEGKLKNPAQPSPDADSWRCSLAPVSDPIQLEQTWRSLEIAAQAPFFLSWDWIGCWLKTIPPNRQPDLLRIENAGQVIGLAFLSACSRRWLGLIPRRGLYLHETGNAALDALTIEYNGILATPAFREEAARRMVEWLLNASRSDELHLSGVPAAMLRAFDGDDVSIRLRDTKPVYAIDLSRAAAERGDFMAMLSANTRAQLRRAIRQYETLGRLRIVEAATARDALEMLTEMIPLHQAYWRQKGRDGSFANPSFLSFHRRLIHDSFENGCIQFLRCDAGESVVGYLYNFKKADHVYSYQSGFDYELLPRSKPGWVCHYLAIEENLRRHMAVYDLLAGHSQFKSSFAKPTDELIWVIVERNGLLPAIDRSLRALKGRITARTARQPR